MTAIKPEIKRNKLSLAITVVGVCAALIHFADRLLGVTVEIFTYPIYYFSGAWTLDVFLVPFIAGTLLGYLYGYGAKWLSYVPPLLVRGLSYYQVKFFMVLPFGMHLIPMGWWGFFLILTLETSMAGAILGESLNKRAWGRRERHLVYKSAADKKKEEQLRSAENEQPSPSPSVDQNES